MNLKILKDQELLSLGKTKSLNERQLSLEVIKIIKEVESRMLHLKMGYPSLFEFVRTELGFEEASALRRISAARLLKDIPELEEKIINNEISLTSVSLAQGFFRKEEKNTSTKLGVEKKKEILSLLENKSTRETEKILISISPESYPVKEESVRMINNDHSRMNLTIDHELLNTLDKLKNLMSHKISDGGYIEVIRELSKMGIKHYQKLGRLPETVVEVPDDKKDRQFELTFS